MSPTLIRHVRDLFRCLLIEYSLVLGGLSFLRRGNQKSHFDFKQFGDLPKEVKESASPVSLDALIIRAFSDFGVGTSIILLGSTLPQNVMQMFYQVRWRDWLQQNVKFISSLTRTPQ